ncbi:MAG: hypothetical protein ABW160_18895 [Candidatus Thiodiazotropha sp. 4PDIV1]
MIEKEKDQISTPITPYQWWSTKRIAEFLDIGERQVRDRFTKDPNFPKARKPYLASHIGQPRWKSSEVIAWAEENYLSEEEAKTIRKLGRPRKASKN